MIATDRAVLRIVRDDRTIRIGPMPRSLAIEAAYYIVARGGVAYVADVAPMTIDTLYTVKGEGTCAL